MPVLRIYKAWAYALKKKNGLKTLPFSDIILIPIKNFELHVWASDKIHIIITHTHICISTCIANVHVCVLLQLVPPHLSHTGVH